MFCEKGVLRNFTKFTGKHLYQSFFVKKETGRLTTLLKKSLWHRCFSVNFAKFLRTPFLQNTSGWLLLKVTQRRVVLTQILMFQSTCKWYEWLEFLENGEIFLNSNVETITLDESETDWQITEEKDGFLRQKYGNFKLKFYRT